MALLGLWALYGAVAVLLTYGLTASLLLSPARIAVLRWLIQTRPGIGGWGVAGAYCPVCVGFWVSLAVQALAVTQEPLVAVAAGRHLWWAGWVFGLLVLSHSGLWPPSPLQTELEAALGITRDDVDGE